MKDRWEVKCREVHMDNSQKYQIWLNGCSIGEIVNCFDAVEKLQRVFDTIEAQQQENIEANKDYMEQVNEVDRLCGECTRLSNENEQLQAQNEQLHTIVDETRGVLGNPNEYELKRFGLTESLADAGRYWFKSSQENTGKLHDYMLQLQAQNGAMREALRHGVDLADGLYGTSEFVCWAHDDAEPALSSEAGRNYHNPADVAEIERLKVLTLKPTVYVTGSTTRPLEQIDKAGGEK